MLENKEITIKRLRYQSWHRGCKETDEILGAYADAHLQTMADADILLFKDLLDEDDGMIWHWLLGQKTADEKYASLIASIIAFQHKRVTLP